MMWIVVLPLLILASTTPTTLSTDFNFSFPSFGPDSCGPNGQFICMGSSLAKNGTLIITPATPNTTFLVGRVLYKTPVLAWPATFRTTFTIRIIPVSAGADGMAFVMAQDAQPSTPQSSGSFLGIRPPVTQPGPVFRQLAVELDTYKNEEFVTDPDDNHIAIDTVDVHGPVAVKSLNDTGINLKSGKEITFQITYNGTDKILRIYGAYSGRPFINILNQRIIMKDTVPSQVYVGFSAATGTLLESHEVLRWNFSSIQLPQSSLGGNTGLTMHHVFLVIILPIVLTCSILTLGVVLLARYLKEKRRINKRKWEIEVLTRSAANAPKMFTYGTLSKATRNFSKQNLLGSGGFGSVYKGRLSDPPMTIAVKKISATSNQGEKEYLAEICTIGRLRHKNLVQLQGWCHDRGQLLLVYEYMTNGSLDKYIEQIQLSWEQRYKILSGLASGLVYLHEECGNPVVHRDIKPNNVMIDSDFNARIGDFGLARLVRDNKSMTTTVAGTLGYMAPEVAYIGRATRESDVYSFGMVVVEVVSGRRWRWIVEEDKTEEKNLVEYLWESYERGELIKCVDPRLHGDFNEEQAKRALMVGLACLYPDTVVRPTMRKVLQIFLDTREPLMALPSSRPLAFSLPFAFSSSFNATGINLSSSSNVDVDVGSM